MDNNPLAKIVRAFALNRCAVSPIKRERLPYDAECALSSWAGANRVPIEACRSDFYRLSFPNLDLVEVFLVDLSDTDENEFRACVLVQGGRVIGDAS